MSRILHEVCSLLFAEPSRLVKAHSFPLGPQPGGALAHTHDDILQFDLAVRCGGKWTVEGVPREISGATLCVFYPEQWHSYAVFGHALGARVWSLKLRLEPTHFACKTRVWRTHETNFSQAEALVKAWNRLILTWSRTQNARLETDSSPSPLQTLRLCELLCLWPLNAQAKRGSDAFFGGESRVEAAAQFLENNLHRAVSMSELAAHVHLSPRHLARMFAENLGQSPHDYARHRRVQIARDWLLENEASVNVVAQNLGFSSPQAFSRWFKTHTGFSPRQWRDKI